MFFLTTLLLGSILAQAAPPTPIEPAVIERSFNYKGYLYINEGTNIVVVSKNNPAKAIRSATGGMSFRRFEFSLTGRTPLLVAHDFDRVLVYDLSKPTNPVLFKTLTYSTDRRVEAIHVSGTRLYVLEWYHYINSYYNDYNLHVYDLASRSVPQIGLKAYGAILSDNGTGRIATLDNNHILVNLTAVHLQTLNIQNPANIYEVFTWFGSDANGGMLVWKNILYHLGIWDFTGSYFAWNITNPLEPMPLGYKQDLNGNTNYPDSFTLLEKNGRRFIYTGFTDYYYDRFGVIEVTNPATPVMSGLRRIATPTGDLVPGDTDIIGNKAYLFGWNYPFPPVRYRYYLVTFDLSNPANPAQIGAPVELPFFP